MRVCANKETQGQADFMTGETRLWIVRAGAHGERELSAIDQNKLLPGFLEVSDLSQLDSRDAILALLQEVMPDEGKNRLRNFAAQLNQFVNKIQIGDYVVMPRKVTNGVAIGVVTGGYEFDASSDFKHSRTVEWKEESLLADARPPKGVVSNIRRAVRRNTCQAAPEADLGSHVEGVELVRQEDMRFCAETNAGEERKWHG